MSHGRTHIRLVGVLLLLSLVAPADLRGAGLDLQSNEDARDYVIALCRGLRLTTERAQAERLEEALRGSVLKRSVWTNKGAVLPATVERIHTSLVDLDLDRQTGRLSSFSVDTSAYATKVLGTTLERIEKESLSSITSERYATGLALRYLPEFARDLAPALTHVETVVTSMGEWACEFYATTPNGWLIGYRHASIWIDPRLGIPTSYLVMWHDWPIAGSEVRLGREEAVRRAIEFRRTWLGLKAGAEVKLDRENTSAELLVVGHPCELVEDTRYRGSKRVYISDWGLVEENKREGRLAWEITLIYPSVPKKSFPGVFVRPAGSVARVDAQSGEVLYLKQF